MQRANPFKEGDRVEGRDSTIRGIVRRVLSADYVMIYEESSDMDMDIHVLELVLAEWQGDGVGHADKKEHPEPKKPASVSVDLHYEKLPSSFKRSSNAPIEAQLSYFRYILENGIRSGAHQLTFIHGKGSGELKQRLIQEIRRDKRIRSYKELREPLETLAHAIVVVC